MRDLYSKFKLDAHHFTPILISEDPLPAVLALHVNEEYGQ